MCHPPTGTAPIMDAGTFHPARIPLRTPAVAATDRGSAGVGNGAAGCGLREARYGHPIPATSAIPRRHRATGLQAHRCVVVGVPVSGRSPTFLVSLGVGTASPVSTPVMGTLGLVITGLPDRLRRSVVVPAPSARVIVAQPVLYATGSYCVRASDEN